MLKQETPRRGRDFLIGFIPSLILALIGIAPLFFHGFSNALNFLLVAGTVLFGAALITLVCHRPFIALGIITVLVSSPFLLIGSCLAFAP